jgi:hypothetical protein
VKDALPTQRLHDWELHARSASALQMGRNVTSEGWGFLQDRRYLLHDRDAKFSDSFRDTVMAGGVKRSNCRQEVRI